MRFYLLCFCFCGDTDPLAGLTDFAPPAPEAPSDALFLDLDGTLAEIADDPAAARVSAPMLAVLREVARAGAVAVLTGRRINDADRMLDGAVEAIAGLHGLERRLAPELWVQHARQLTAMRDAVSALKFGIELGQLNARLEDKGASVALHYRHAPEQGAAVRDLAERLAARQGLRAMPGKMVVELVPPDAFKGDALRDFMRVSPFSGRRPVAVGDDVTDESMFEAANALGGVSILVGPPRKTAARYRLDDVKAVRAWLARALETQR